MVRCKFLLSLIAKQSLKLPCAISMTVSLTELNSLWISGSSSGRSDSAHMTSSASCSLPFKINLQDVSFCPARDVLCIRRTNVETLADPE
jgi:hypothetical protein